MGHDFFVSYSTRDKLFVDALVHRLEETGYRCWYAPRDITAGVSWPEAISEAIRSVPVMLLVFSDSSNQSDEISRELTLASNHKCVVIPVRIEDVMPSPALEYYLSDRHWLDVFDLETEAAIKRILEGLEKYLSRLPGPGGTLGVRETAESKKPAKKPFPRKAVFALVAVALIATGALFLRQEAPVSDPTAHLLKPLRKAVSTVTP